MVRALSLPEAGAVDEAGPPHAEVAAGGEGASKRRDRAPMDRLCPIGAAVAELIAAINAHTGPATL